MGRLAEHVVLITGAARGIGRAVALACAAEGARIVAGDLEVPAATADAVRAAGQACLSVVADVSRRDQVQALVERALREFGRIDVVVSNAAVGFPERLLEITEEHWDRVLAVNLRGALFCVQAALPPMLASRRGSIVLISSIAGRRSSLVNGAHYTCSKYGLVGLTRHLATELAGTGVRVNCVCPGPVETRFVTAYTTAEERAALAQRTPLRSLATPEDVAEVVTFLAGSGARHMHGAIVDVNGGLY
ncbi:MAG TPA: SDR family oxidoreductase [bacterium]|nr:SDR family oxidoreductase [bacterium]